MKVEPIGSGGQYMAEVYYLPHGKSSEPGAILSLLGGMQIESRFNRTDIIAVKIHPGEEGNTSFVGAHRVREIIDSLGIPEDRVFLTDTTVLYPGRRMIAPEYVRLAREHGFGLPMTPPFIVADGLHGENETVVALPKGFETPEAHLASLIIDSDAMIVVSHFKGHLLTGFGGAIKNLGMGCASRAGKLYQHSSVKPEVVTAKCNACGICAEHCHSGAITITEYATISDDLCSGCGECLGRCPCGALRVNWNQEKNIFMRRMVEYAAAAVLASNPILYVNFVTSVVPDCDCMSDREPPLVEDIGILASLDPVALDRACFDLVTEAVSAPGSTIEAAPGEDKFKAYRPEINGMLQLSIAESLGIGSMDYQLIEVE